MTFTIKKTTYYLFAGSDEEVYDTIEAETFEAAKDIIKAGVDVFRTIPDIILENEDCIEFTINRNRYSNCTFSMSNEQHNNKLTDDLLD